MNKYIIIGLGNPGEKYANTRHNAGKMFVQWMKKVQEGEIELVQTDCFMNESGGFVARVARNKSPIIAHDDLDLPLGQFKIQFAKGPEGHKGLLSIYQALGTKNFWHIRIGVDTRPDHSISGDDFVLQPFKREEREVLEKTFGEIEKALADQIAKLQITKNK